MNIQEEVKKLVHKAYMIMHKPKEHNKTKYSWRRKDVQQKLKTIRKRSATY